MGFVEGLGIGLMVSGIAVLAYARYRMIRDYPPIDSKPLAVAPREAAEMYIRQPSRITHAYVGSCKIPVDPPVLAKAGDVIRIEVDHAAGTASVTKLDPKTWGETGGTFQRPDWGGWQ